MICQVLNQWYRMVKLTALSTNEVSHKCFFTNMPYLSYRVVYNWAMGRININEYILQNIAFTLGVTTDYLFGGPTEDTKNKNDDDILKTVHRNLNDLFCLDNLTEERKSAAHLNYVTKNIYFL